MSRPARRSARELPATACPMCSKPSGTSLRAHDGAGLYCLACGHRWLPRDVARPVTRELFEARDAHQSVVARLEPERVPTQPPIDAPASLLTEDERREARELAELARTVLARHDMLIAMMHDLATAPPSEAREVLATLRAFDGDLVTLVAEVCVRARRREGPAPLVRLADYVRFAVRATHSLSAAALQYAATMHGRI